MHELSVVLEIFELVEEIMTEQDLKKVSSVSVQAGELSGILPDYFKECWKVSRIGSVFENTELILDYIPARGKCSCGCEFELMKNSRVCPECKKSDYEITAGREFSVTQIEAC